MKANTYLYNIIPVFILKFNQTYLCNYPNSNNETKDYIIDIVSILSSERVSLTLFDGNYKIEYQVTYYGYQSDVMLYLMCKLNYKIRFITLNDAVVSYFLRSILQTVSEMLLRDR